MFGETIEIPGRGENARAGRFFLTRKIPFGVLTTVERPHRTNAKDANNNEFRTQKRAVRLYAPTPAVDDHFTPTRVYTYVPDSCVDSKTPRDKDRTAIVAAAGGWGTRTVSLDVFAETANERRRRRRRSTENVRDSSENCEVADATKVETRQRFWGVGRAKCVRSARVSRQWSSRLWPPTLKQSRVVSANSAYFNQASVDGRGMERPRVESKQRQPRTASDRGSGNRGSSRFLHDRSTAQWFRVLLWPDANTTT